ncbi:hypothetical protein CROQUDRAFT_698858 [Cronartium quercuum f. sp. fusiforme G11]|uniref:Uncharacterized protein n=1 Tax=Cronartium quercuum f. sp. fusiforme G11 TaxID=708437 RepID=A0A9P6NJZ4_9BASI|nr:hypothetical protein CROQUDRAFT_698858 [Cronartium quercuum f. sp. fusiforme G11]
MSIAKRKQSLGSKSFQKRGLEEFDFVEDYDEAIFGIGSSLGVEYYHEPAIVVTEPYEPLLYHHSCSHSHHLSDSDLEHFYSPSPCPMNHPTSLPSVTCIPPPGAVYPTRPETSDRPPQVQNVLIRVLPQGNVAQAAQLLKIRESIDSPEHRLTSQTSTTDLISSKITNIPKSGGLHHVETEKESLETVNPTFYSVSAGTKASLDDRIQHSQSLNDITQESPNYGSAEVPNDTSKNPSNSEIARSPKTGAGGSPKNEARGQLDDEKGILTNTEMGSPKIIEVESDHQEAKHDYYLKMPDGFNQPVEQVEESVTN